MTLLQPRSPWDSRTEHPTDCIHVWEDAPDPALRSFLFARTLFFVQKLLSVTDTYFLFLSSCSVFPVPSVYSALGVGVSSSLYLPTHLPSIYFGNRVFVSLPFLVL